MNRYSCIITFLLFFIAAYGCKKHKTNPTYPPPQWAVDSSGKYPASMTAVVQLPEGRIYDVSADDQLGAFVGEECRGLAQAIPVGTEYEYFVLIHGTASEKSRISFRYYNASSSAMLATDPFLDFAVDGNYGTADVPVRLKLKPVK